jgi:hypothetical protein
MIILTIIVMLILTAICGFAASWTGQGGNKNWRRVFVPAVSAAFGIVFLGFWQIFIMARSGAISMGYGIPDPTDEGSVLGRFWFKVMGEDPYKASIFTRGTIGIMECLGILSIPIVSHRWILWILASSLLVWNNIFWGAIKEKEGHFNFAGKEMLWEEFALHGIDTLIIFILILVSAWK